MRADIHDMTGEDVLLPVDPGYAQQQADFTKRRTLLGTGLWLSRAYPQVTPPFTLCCEFMKNPSAVVERHAKYAVMHLLASPHPTRFGGHGEYNLIARQPPIPPFSREREMGFHVFVDGSLGRRSTSGALLMLAGGPLSVLMARQHIKSPDSHTTEVVAASSALHRVIPCRGIAQEVRITQEFATPFYMDSSTTLFVANDTHAAKKSVWIARRASALQEGVTHDDVLPIWIRAVLNCANFFTKYESFQEFRLHVWYFLNLDAPMPSIPGDDSKL